MARGTRLLISSTDSGGTTTKTIGMMIVYFSLLVDSTVIDACHVGMFDTPDPGRVLTYLFTFTRSIVNYIIAITYIKHVKAIGELLEIFSYF